MKRPFYGDWGGPIRAPKEPRYPGYDEYPPAEHPNWDRLPPASQYPSWDPRPSSDPYPSWDRQPPPRDPYPGWDRPEYPGYSEYEYYRESAPPAPRPEWGNYQSSESRPPPAPAPVPADTAVDFTDDYDVFYGKSKFIIKTCP